MIESIDTTKPFQVFPYDHEVLVQVLAAVSPTPVDRVRRKPQLDYFRSYFGHFQEKGPLTLVVEWKYTDRDYLEDFAAYYVRCFQEKYSSLCARLHFFSVAFDEAALRMAVAGQSRDLLERLQSADHYCGFVVAKPLPDKFIGRTCLRTYEPELPERRYYPVAHVCESHLLGVDLKVISLPFQEQDTVAAACATSALWSTLQATARLFQHEIRSPIEITRIATEQSPSLQRDIPNHGLTSLQMAVAIRKSGLEPELIGTGCAADLQATTYAYLRSGIPLVMNAALYDVSDPQHPVPLEEDGAYHAVVITGFSLGHTSAAPYPGTQTLLRCSRIDEIYVHDDQIGPFARMTFGVPAIAADSEHQTNTIPFWLGSSWRGRSAGAPTGTVRFAPIALIVPLYHKIRIRFDTILHWVLNLDAQLQEVRPRRLPADLEWDIHLATGSSAKSDMRTADDVDEEQRWRVLERPLPRFVWRATGWNGRKRCVGFLLDATDIESGDFLIDSIVYDL